MCKNSFKSSDKRALRRSLGQYPTGVAVVTTVDEAGRCSGMTINSFSSISMNPPLVAWCVDRSAGSYRAFERCGSYTISVLAENQADIARRFATAGADKFADIATTDTCPDEPGALQIPGACAWLHCTVYRRLVVGDHLMLIGEVQAFNAADRRPLVFARGDFSAIQDPHQQTGLNRAA